MTPLVVTPGPAVVTEAAALVLSDGQTELDCLGSPPWGLYLVELVPPIVPRENTYALAPEGQRRVRSRPLNATGSMRLRIDRDIESSAAFTADVDALEKMVESAHKRKGTLVFTPPNLREVTYDLVSCQLTEAPADGPAMTARRQEFVVEFETRPYGRLEAVTVFEDEVLTGPIAGIEVPEVDGSVDALAELTLTDTSAESADFVEFGIGQQGYDPDAPLALDEDDLIISGFAGTQPGGAGTQIEAELTETPVACCATGNQVHGGRQKISVRLSTEEENVWVRLAYKFDEGALSYGRWIEIPVTTGVQEVTLAVIDIGDASRWEAQIEAFQSGGEGRLLIRDVYVIPAEVSGRIRQPPSQAVGTDYVVKENFQSLTPGDLNGQTSTIGGLWAAPADFDVDAPGISVERVADSDGSNQLALLADDLGALDSTVRTSYSYVPDPVGMDLELGHGLVCRYVDASNYAALFLAHAVAGSSGIHILMARARVAGVDTDRFVANGAWGTIEVPHSLRLVVDGAGVWTAYVDGARLMGGQNDDLATGGALDEGKTGLFSYSTGTSSGTGNWWALNVLSAPEDHVLWAGKKVRFTDEGAFRQAESGTLYAATALDGDTLRIPPATAALNSSLLVVRRRMHDIDSGLTSDGRSSDLTATLEITPRVALY